MTLAPFTVADLIDEQPHRPAHLAVVENLIVATARRRALADTTTTARDHDAALLAQRAVYAALTGQRYHPAQNVRLRWVVLDEWTDTVLEADLTEHSALELVDEQNRACAAEADRELRARLADDHGLRPHWPHLDRDADAVAATRR